MSVLSRLHPEHPSPRQLNLVIAGSSEVPAVVAEAGRLQSSLQKAGHRVTSRLALRNDWSEGRFHPDDGTTADLVLALGGDGTILRAAEMVHSAAIAILGVNLGHVGFLAEAEMNAATAVVDAVVQRQWHVEERLTLDVQVTQSGSVVFSTFALNEVSIEKSPQLRMLDLIVEVDGRPLSRWGCDGVICATPTGSTAYAFSAGGPVVWPEVEALLLVPLSAHALFSRPLLVGPSGWLAIELPPSSSAVMWADGRRSCDLGPGSRIEVRRNIQPVLLARLDDAPFTDRLVAKFDLPVNGWRGLGGSRG